jgi:peptide/nickel transport system substrate-binding protein
MEIPVRFRCKKVELQKKRSGGHASAGADPFSRRSLTDSQTTRRTEMMKRYLILVMALLVIGLPLFAGGTTEKTEEAAAEEGPQYGGTFTIYNWNREDPPIPDIADGQHMPTQWLSPIQEQPVMGDFLKFGPRGTNEYDFYLSSYVPTKYMTGWILESWEIEFDKYTWHVRPGIYWAPNEQQSAWMPARELTAQDVVEDLLYFREAPGGKFFKERSGEIRVTGEYDLEIEITQYNPALFRVIAYEDRALISPPEMLEAGADKWENQVGTGPWMFKEYVKGSHMSYSKNPNWWMTTTIDGVVYDDIPFADEMVAPIIPDESTQIAALRTGKLDIFINRGGVSPQYWDTLAQTSPELKSKKVRAGNGTVLVLNCTQPPFDDMAVRRAVMVGTDLEAFAELQGAGPVPKHWFPLVDANAAYTPLKDLPEDIGVLYEYDPAKARQMLADAGYPNGFKTETWLHSTPAGLDNAALLKDQWSKIGVEVDIKAVDQTTHSTKIRKTEYTGTSWDGPAVGDAMRNVSQHGLTGNFFNTPKWSNPKFDELVDKASYALDTDEQNRLLKEASLIMLREAPYIPLFMRVSAIYWWPWIQNYYGEVNIHDSAQPGVLLAHAWLDQKMKKEMGY